MEYLNNVWKVLKECYWATPKKSLKTTFAVLLTVVIMCAIYFGLDSGFNFLIRM